jgi:hypothetical protein
MSHISEVLSSYIDFSELNDHSTSVVKLVQDSDVVDPTLTGLTDTLSTENDSLTLAIRQERKNKYTELLKTQDNRRDNWFKCLKGHALADINCPDFPIATAAQSVYRIISNHGVNLHVESYERESALLESLFKDLDKESMQAHLVTIGLITKYEALKVAQREFKATYLERSTTESAKEPIVAASIVHKSVKHSLKLVTDYINIMVSAKKAPYEPLAKAIDHLVDNINKKIRARIAAGRKKEEENDDKQK